MIWIKENFCALILIALFAFMGVPTVHAQFVSDTDIDVTITPNNPGAFQDATITLESLSTDLNIATISWSSNGKTMLSGIGKKTYSFKTGAIGSLATIEAAVSIKGVPTITKRIIVQPLETDLLWEAADSYVPPFYKGKALIPSEGLIKVVAIPNIRNTQGIKMKPGEFNYVWNRNYESDAAASGFGKNSFTFRTTYLNDQERVSVNVSSLEGGYKAGNDLVLTTTAPKILFYQNDTKRGIRYEQAVSGSNYFLVEPEGTSFIAEPYFFSPKIATSPNLSYVWTINDEDIATPSIKNEFSLKPQASGLARIKVAVENVTTLFQSASKTLLVNLQTQ